MSDLVAGHVCIVKIKAPSLASNAGGGAEIKDAEGNVIGRGATSGGARVSVSVKDPSGQDFTGATVNREGTDEFVVKFTPSVAGDYTVALLNDGQAVDGGSKTFAVLPRLVAKMVEQDIDADWNANFKFAFEGYSPATLTPTIKSLDGNTSITELNVAKYNSLEADGTWTVKFSVPEVDGLNVTLEGDGRAVENNFEINLS